MARNSFFGFVGCWNNGSCLDNENAFYYVITHMKQLIPPPEFIIIAGDNYYPEKKDMEDSDQQKHYVINERNLRSGFECLPANIKTYIIYGNHDLDTNTDKKIYFKNNEQADSCEIMKLEKESIQQSIVENKKIELNSFFGIDNENNNTSIIMFDTNLFDNETRPDCYLDANATTLEALYNKQMLEIQQFVEGNNEFHNQPNHNVILIGHYPIVSMKKKKKINQPTTIFPKMLQFFVDIKSMYQGKNPKFTYLCADTHLYQKGRIKIKKKRTDEITDEIIIMEFDQYIVGTGGAKLDTFNPDIPELERSFFPNNYDVTYLIEANEIAQHGYLKVNYIDQQLDFQFESVAVPRLIKSGGNTSKKIQRFSRCNSNCTPIKQPGSTTSKKKKKLNKKTIRNK